MKHWSILRVWSDVFNDQARYDACLNYCMAHVRTLDEIIFFTQCTHSVRSVNAVKEKLEVIGGLMERLRGRGIKLGIDVLCTVGHGLPGGAEAVDTTLSGHDFYMDEQKDVNCGRLCSSSPKTFDYLKEVYSLAAALKPDTIHVDDDLHYGADCRCPNCERLFAESKYFDVPDGRRLFTRERVCKILRHIEKTVHAVDPNITLGWMTCIYGNDGLDYTPYVEALEGEANVPVVWRPGGGVYTDESVSAMIAKAHSIARQNSALPYRVEQRCSEIENFPYAHLKKTPSFTAFEVLTYLAAGCTGTAFNFMGQMGRIEEFFPFLDIIDDIAPFSSAIVEHASDEPSCGIGKPLPTFPSRSVVTSADSLYQFGLPPAYGPRQSVCHVLPGCVARTLARERLREMLSQGVMLDGEALTFLNDSGLGEYTGFSAVPTTDIALMEQTLEHPLIPMAGILRDVHPTFGWTSPVFAIERTAPSAEYLTRLVDYYGKPAGFASGVFENSLGGRVFVSGFAPFDWLESDDRLMLLKRLFRHISHDGLPAYVESSHKIALWSRGGCRFLVNLAAGSVTNVRLAVKTETPRMELLRKGNHQVLHSQLSSISSDGPYRIFAIGDMAYQEVVAVVKWGDDALKTV